jgi:hypothetical protein
LPSPIFRCDVVGCAMILNQDDHSRRAQGKETGRRSLERWRR